MKGRFSRVPSQIKRWLHRLLIRLGLEKKPRTQHYFILSQVVVLLIVVVLTVVLFQRSRRSDQDHQAVIQHVSEFMVLPDEEPTVAEVTDKDQLQGQEFFDPAENGDVVLFYTKSQKAILYRPSIKKVVEVARIEIGTNGE